MLDKKFCRRDLLVLLGLTSFAKRALADLYDDYLNSPSKKPFVAFLARGGVPGHAFVGLGVTLEAGLRVYERFYGYYPVGDDKAEVKKLVLGKTSGAIDHKWKDTSWEVSYIASIDNKARETVVSVLEQWKVDDPKYNLFASGGKNCSSLAGEVATAAGLKAPSGAGSMLPVDYIRKLKASNGN
jgi:hypothetical protein